MKALDTFRHPIYKHNCAQAIANRWHELYTEGIAIVEKYAPYRGGQAPGGVCGALYAAMEACPEHAEEIRNRYIQKVGAEHCVRIKTMTQTPCPVCVDTADKLLEEFTSRG